MRFLKAGIYTAAATIAIAAALPQTRNALETYIAEKQNNTRAAQLLTEIPAPESIVPAAYARIVADAAVAVHTTDNHTVFRTATWCPPCDELKTRMQQTGEHADNTIYTDEDNESNHYRREFAKHKTYIPPGLPSITKNIDGRIVTYTGFIPGKNIMFDADKSPVPLEKILEKN